MKLVFHSPLDIAESTRELGTSIDAELYSPFTPSRFAGSKPVIGKISDTGKFRLHKRQLRNPLAPVFYGMLKAKEPGTIIEGYFTENTSFFNRLQTGESYE